MCQQKRAIMKKKAVIALREEQKTYKSKLPYLRNTEQMPMDSTKSLRTCEIESKEN